MKKFLFTVLSLMFVLISFAYGTLHIDEKLKQSFQVRFPHAQNVSWYESSDAYEVYFVEAKVQTRIIYAKDNSSVNFIRYYKDSVLPYPVQYLLQKQYPGKKVFGVTETSTVSKNGALSIDYHLVLEDLKKWYLVTINKDGTVSLDEKYNKQQPIPERKD